LLSWLKGGIEERLAFMAPSRRLRLAQVLDILDHKNVSPRPVRVLDAGCGDGLLTMAIAKRHPSWSFVGVDLDNDLLWSARQRAAARGLDNVRFERADLTQPLPGMDFDVVLAIECLEEIPDDRRAIEVMARAVAPGGLLVCHVPERSWEPILPGSAPTWRNEVRHGYGAEEIRQAMRDVGLEPTTTTPTLHGTVTVAQELRDRYKSTGLAVRALLFPLMLAAVRLERWGLTWGTGRALLTTARRPAPDPAIG
jgi:SAM-dependent methyltransferase